MDTRARLDSDQRRRGAPLRVSRAAIAAVGTAVTVLLISLAGAFPAGAKTSGIPDVTVLFGRAVQIVHTTKPPTYARAVVLEADGITRGGRCTAMGCGGGHGTKSAAGIVSWRFVFDNQSSRSRFASATISYGPAPKGFGKVTGQTSPFVDDVRIPKAPRMTLGEAVRLLQHSGRHAPFFNVTLRNPLGPKASHPLYIFGFANSAFVAVDTVTKKVAPIS